MTRERLQQIAIVMAIIAVAVSALAVVVVEKRNEPASAPMPSTPAPSTPDATSEPQPLLEADAAIDDPPPPEEPPVPTGCRTSRCSGVEDCPSHPCECKDGTIVHTRSCINGCCAAKAEACESSCDEHGGAR